MSNFKKLNIGNLPTTLKKPTLDDIRRKFSAPPEPMRILILFDATGSMSPYWQQVDTTIQEIMGRVFSLGQGTPFLRFTAYRDDCDGSQIIEESPWSQSPQILKTFLRTIECKGGGDFPEAVDRALQQAISEKTLSRVILIGDAPPHSQRDCQREATHLGLLGRPVYPIVIGQAVETYEAFSRIAKLSKGKVIKLENLEELFELISLVVVHAMGGEAMKTYEEKYRISESGKRLLLEFKS